MNTRRTNTVYNCAHCRAAVYFSSVHRRWFHYGANPSCAEGFLCTDVAPVAVTLPQRFAPELMDVHHIRNSTTTH